MIRRYIRNPPLSNTVDLIFKYCIFIYYRQIFKGNCQREKAFFNFKRIFLGTNFFNYTTLNTHHWRKLKLKTFGFS